MMKRVCAAALAAALGVALPAFAQDEPTVETPGVAFAGVIDNAVAAWEEPEGSDASEDDIRDRATYVTGNIAWFMYHEFGHALVTEYNLPMLGKEEDSVDLFATITMVIDANDEVLDALVSEVVEAWFDGGLYANLDWGQHSMDKQRGYNVICMLVGSDPEGYGQYATDAEMPPDRQESCKWDFQKADAAWKSQLEPYWLDEGEEPSIELPVIYNDAGDFGPAREFLEASGVLEAVSNQIRHSFKIETPIVISAELCGQANAFWNPSEKKVVLCYELANYFLERAKIADDEEADGGEDADTAEEPAEDGQ